MHQVNQKKTVTNKHVRKVSRQHSPTIDVNNIKWSTTKYGLRDFIENYRTNLPVFIKIVDGYCSYGEIYAFGTGEVIRISHINLQPRLIAKDKKGNSFSIPLDHPIKFHIVENGELSAPAYLNDLIKQTECCHGTYITPSNRVKLPFFIDADTTDSKKTGVLEMDDVYDDQYLVGNFIDSGEVFTQALYIPLFLNIRFVVATGLTNGEDYNLFIDKVNKSAASIDYSDVKGNPDIICYEDAHDMDHSEYMYIQPKSYVSYKEQHNKPSLKKGTDSEYHSIYEQPDKVQYHDDKVNEYLTLENPPPVKPRLSKDEKTQSRKSIPSSYDKVNPVQSGDIFINQSVTVIGGGNKQQDGDQNKQKNSENSEVSKSEETLLMGTPSDRGISTANTPATKVPKTDSSENTVKTPPPVGPKPVKKPTNKPFYKAMASEPEDKSEIENKLEDCTFKDITEIPDSLSELSMSEIADCLKFIHLDKFVAIFHSNDIDGKLLESLDEDILVKEFNFTLFEAKKLLKFRDGWRPKPR